MNNINWKEVCQSPGYKSLKAAYVKDVKTKQRNKADSLKQFNWVIARAKHYASKRNVTLDVILNEWEADRNYWWLNYYQVWKFPKLPAKPRKSFTKHGRRSPYYKSLSPRERLALMRRYRAEAK